MKLNNLSTVILIVCILCGVVTAATTISNTEISVDSLILGGQSVVAYTSALNTKLAGIDTGATDDQTGAEIKTLYEVEANAYTDTKDIKLTGIDTGADVTGSNPPQTHGASVHTDRTRFLFVSSPHHHTGTTAFTGIQFDKAADEKAFFNFKLPADFQSLNNIKVIYRMVGPVAGDIVISAYSNYGTVGEGYNTHTESEVGSVVGAGSTTNIIGYTLSGFLTSATASDYINIQFKRNGADGSDDALSDTIFLGILVEYTADM